jgi:uncharacterized membrane protein
MLAAVRFANIVLAALIAGGMFVIWAGYNPAALSPSTYVEQQQNAIRGLNLLMPVLGGITILLTVISALAQRKDRKAFVLLLVAAGFLVISGLITRFGNQPINAMMMTWDIASPPANWADLRDQWWGFHRLRTITGLAALALITWAEIRRNRGIPLPETASISGS